MQRFLIAILTLSALILGCSSDDDSITISREETYRNGILVTNEGPFNAGSGTVTFISDDFTVVEESIFKKKNAEDLGNIVQSIGFEGDRAYIVVNNSHSIQVVDRFTFNSVALINEGLENPRFFTVSNGKGYVTNWGDPADEADDFIAVINLETNTVTQTIPVVLGPETITANNDFVYVAHEGGFGQNNQVSVIDSSIDKVLKTLTVGDFPNSLYWDAHGTLWVLSGGAPAYTGTETPGVLSKINVNDNTIETSFDFSNTQHPANLCGEGNSLYYSLGDGVYAFSSGDATVPNEAYITNVSFYAMTVNRGKLYGSDAKDFASKGDLHVYDLMTKDLIESVQVGLVPGGIYFN
ncbi:YncE family protein [Pareuzebyella sediminis]|uniref:YncE family protein n=1 Tax=Pareuzebyella sediminis TaxID=2607998 RepID=UPI0011EBDCBC|nr:DUF5074 domain-containing protein [Pareuzebyella sediminis]